MTNKNKSKNNKNSGHRNVQMSKRGFTLVETLISILIFSLVMVMMAGAFSSFLKSYAQAKKIQKNVENAQFAMNLMAKTLRTSKVMSPVPNVFPLHIYDYSRSSEQCIIYDVNNNKIMTGSATAATPDECVFSGISANSELTSDVIYQASITTIPTAGTVFGKATVLFNVLDQSQSNTVSAIPIQTTVSLRQ